MNNPANDSKNETKSSLLRVVNLEENIDPDSKPDEIESKNYSRDEISPGKLITLNFSLAPANEPSAFIDSNFHKAPVSFKYGDGSLLSSFEEVMIGLKAGEKQLFTVPAKQAFGLRNEDNIHCYPRYQFPADLIIEKGLMINFSDVGGNEQAGVIAEFSTDEVFVDFNHPLADIDILFTVEIKAVELV
ncbi:MAG: FKBP-type peptidyl-prolyl cis-trans isomerase [Gammaproteobacteria bacterium]|jgi:FKBP-type peptidyl-prolyl cis-trans isomerase SlpA|nr:FKBP-type peptidyl-prolyl cis-trans isomerase [Gammaproteobacteria bacterium]